MKTLSNFAEESSSCFSFCVGVGSGKTSIQRPGINFDTLDRAGIKYVTEERSEPLVGFRVEGLAIPYFTIGGQPLMVNGRNFHRIRVAHPKKGSAKYLAPKDSGAQLYIPPSHRAERVLYLTEGEFKALSLSEAGVFAVGVGGITSAMTEGKLIFALQNLIEKKAVSEVRFLGDADTPLIFDFCNEAIKMRAALPDHVRLVLPLVPFDGPKGIDDFRDEYPDGFHDWLHALPSIEVKKHMTPGGLAVKRISLIFEKLEYAEHELKILKFGKRLDAVALDQFIALTKKYFGITASTFKKAVFQYRESTEAVAEVPEVYFDGSRYFRRNGSCFDSICREDCLLELRAQGFSQSVREGCTMSPLELALHAIQTGNRVSFAGSICGRPTGAHLENGITVLATRGPNIIQAGPGNPKPLIDFLSGLFGRDAGDQFWQNQFISFCGWLRHFRSALNKHDQHLPGQALALVGPSDCGKSVLQAMITAATTGREASAGLWLLGRTDFNKELWAAEHLTLDDENLPPDKRKSSEVRDRLKKLAITNLFPLHAKHRDAEDFRPIWRVSVSANLDDESIDVLPAPDESFADKIIYLLCHRPQHPFHDGSEEGRATWYQSLVESIPAFLKTLESDIPEEYRAARFYVREFHHPEVLRAIYASAPEADLGELLESYFASTRKPIEGRASKIMECLKTALGDRRVHDVSSSTRLLGWQLGRLSNLPGWSGRIIKTPIRVNGRIKNEPVNHWQILPLRSNAE